MHGHVAQFPLDGLIAAEEALVVQAQPDHLHNRFDLDRRAGRTAERLTRLIVHPGRILRGMPRDPFVQPPSRLPQRGTDPRWIFSGEIPRHG